MATSFPPAPPTASFENVTEPFVNDAAPVMRNLSLTPKTNDPVVSVTFLVLTVLLSPTVTVEVPVTRRSSVVALLLAPSVTVAVVSVRSPVWSVPTFPSVREAAFGPETAIVVAPFTVNVLVVPSETVAPLISAMPRAVKLLLSSIAIEPVVIFKS